MIFGTVLFCILNSQAAQKGYREVEKEEEVEEERAGQPSSRQPRIPLICSKVEEEEDAGIKRRRSSLLSNTC